MNNILRKIVLLSLIGLSVFCTSSTVKLKKFKPAPGISVKLPQDFLVMSDNDIAARYPAYRKPLAMYTAPNGRTDFGVNFANNLWGKNLKILKDVYKASIMNMFTKVNFIQDTITQIRGRDVIVLEFDSEQPSKATSTTQESIKFYTYLVYAVVDKKIYIFNFSTPYYLKDEWQATAHQIMQSIKLSGPALKMIPDNSVVAPKQNRGGKSSKEIMLEQRKGSSFPTTK